ncbi:hypothetical protein GIB67_037205 [Kingdonia uniflora]|uniref:DAGKc domain-containing protein n=1 Tax=Kingdonia uniflora TaxID=39325 RepID=A0A7J7MS56_9MAGN|nr:hypothetical protein GIB67_037205 [Kingdonia uniflora]
MLCYQITMAKPSFLRAEQSMASDLTFSSSSSTRRGDLVFVVNPKGANGQSGKDWKKLLPYLRSRLGNDRNIGVGEG